MKQTPLLLAVLLFTAIAHAEEFTGVASATRATCMVRCLATPRLPAYDFDTVQIYASPEVGTGWSYIVDKGGTSYQGAATAAKAWCCAKCLPLRVQTTDAKSIAILKAGEKFVYRVVR